MEFATLIARLTAKEAAEVPGFGRFSVTTRHPVMVRYEPTATLREAMDGSDPAPGVGPPWDTVVADLQRATRARVPGLGTFSVQRTRARSGRNPGTGKPMTIPAMVTVVLGASAELKAALAGATPLRIGLAALDDPHRVAGPTFLKSLVRWRASDLQLPDAVELAERGQIDDALNRIAAHADASGRPAMAAAARSLVGLDPADVPACEPVWMATLRPLHDEHTPKTVQSRIDQAVAAAAEQIQVASGAEPAFFYSVCEAIEHPQDRDSTILSDLLAEILARAVPALEADPASDASFARARAHAATHDVDGTLAALATALTQRARPTDAEAAEAARRLRAEPGSYDEQRWMVETWIPVVFRSLGRTAVLGWAAEAEDAVVARST